MGKEKHMKKVRALFRRSPVISIRDVYLAVGSPEKEKTYPQLLLHNLSKRGEIFRIIRGFYTMHEDPAIAVFCFRPAYIGLQTALSIHGLWEQETNDVIITSNPVRGGMRTVMGSNIIVRRTNPGLMFGHRMEKYGDFYVPVSDIEKTAIDFVHFHEYLDKEVLREIRRRADRRKLERYLKAYSPRTKRLVLKAVYGRGVKT